MTDNELISIIHDFGAKWRALQEQQKQAGGAGDNSKPDFEITATKTVCDPEERARRLNQVYNILVQPDKAEDSKIENLKREGNKCEQLKLL